MSDESFPELAVAVRRRADDITPTPAPWEALQRRHRRNALRRGSMAVATVVATVVLFAVTGGAGLLVAERQDVLPAGPWSGDPELSQGSLWAEELLRHADRALGGSSDGAEAVLYAADLDGSRVALVRVAFSPDGPLYWWFMGPAGSPPDRMQAGDGLAPARAYAVVLPPIGTAPSAATVLALSRPGAEVSVWTNDDVTRDGEALSPRIAGREMADGVYLARVVTPFTHARVELGGLPGGDWAEYVPSDDVQPPPSDDAGWWRAGASGIRGDAAAGPPDKLLIRTVYDALALPSQVPGARVLWTLRDGQDRHSAVALRAPGGGWAVAGIHTEPRVQRADSGYSEGSSVLAAAPRPDGNPDLLSLAWYLDTAVDQEGYDVPSGDRLAVVGPRAATQVRLTVPSAGAVTLPLPTGAGVVRQARVRTVEFLDAAGRSLGRIDVTAPWRHDRRLHQE
jgi:hypothetical protein